MSSNSIPMFRCPFCRTTIPQKDAIATDWFPEYLSMWSENYIQRPVCPTCVRDRLTQDPVSGEFMLMDENGYYQHEGY